MTFELTAEPQGTRSLLARARDEVAHSGELIRLVLSGVHQVDSWVIENRVLPELQRAGGGAFGFTLAAGREQEKSALLIPLPDGSAFARNTAGLWFALEPAEATYAIEHIGFRYAPKNHWEHGFDVRLEMPGQAPITVSPFEVAATWAEITGKKPAGFEGNAVDEMQAFGLKLVDLVFDNQGQLGL